MEVALFVVGVGLGALASWLITRYYYRRAAADAKDAAIAQRMDDCNEADKSFLVALLQTGAAIPRYALINGEFETIDGRKSGWASNTITMIHSLNVRAKHSLQFHGGNDIDEDRQTVSLSDRGRENAEYLVRREYRSARFSSIDDNDSQRLSMFRREQGREPRKGNVKDTGIISSWTIGS